MAHYCPGRRVRWRHFLHQRDKWTALILSLGTFPSLQVGQLAQVSTIAGNVWITTKECLHKFTCSAYKGESAGFGLAVSLCLSQL